MKFTRNGMRFDTDSSYIILETIQDDKLPEVSYKMYQTKNSKYFLETRFDAHDGSVNFKFKMFKNDLKAMQWCEKHDVPYTRIVELFETDEG